MGRPDPLSKRARRAAVAHAGRAAWRALVEGVGAASAAVLIATLHDPWTGQVVMAATLVHGS